MILTGHDRNPNEIMTSRKVMRCCGAGINEFVVTHGAILMHRKTQMRIAASSFELVSDL